MQTSTERRKKPRAKADLPLHVVMPGRALGARVLDVSTSGVRCLTDRQLPVMTQVELSIVVPVAGRRVPGATRDIPCQGVVVRSRAADQESATDVATYDTAIFFTDMRDSDRSELEDFVARARTG